MAKRYFPGHHVVRGKLSNIESATKRDVQDCFENRTREELDEIFKEVTGREPRKIEYGPFADWYYKNVKEGIEKIQTDLDDIEFFPSDEDNGIYDSALLSELLTNCRNYKFDSKWRDKIKSELEFYMYLMNRKDKEEFMDERPDLFESEDKGTDFEEEAEGYLMDIILEKGLYHTFIDPDEENEEARIVQTWFDDSMEFLVDWMYDHNTADMSEASGQAVLDKVRAKLNSLIEECF